MDATIHLGHHFYGAGNAGDDYMLAGFLAACRRAGRSFRLTCCVPGRWAVSQRRRFPEIDWLPYEPTVRAAAVEACSAWLGLGGSPFQTDSGSWFLDHLREEVELCRRFDRPMYYLGVGVNNRESLAEPTCRAVIEQAARVWTRDDQSAALLADAFGPANVTAGADLAHLHLREQRTRPPQPGTLGFVLNFEKREAFNLDALCTILDRARASGRSTQWLVQEHRRFDFTEQTLRDLLPRAQTEATPVFAGDYENDSTEELLSHWPTPEVLVTSRYHAGIVGAWRGSRLVTIERSAKLTGLAAQLGVRTTLPNLLDAEALASAIDASSVVDRSRLRRLAEQAEHCCREFFTTMPRRRGFVTRVVRAAAMPLRNLFAKNAVVHV